MKRLLLGVVVSVLLGVPLAPVAVAGCKTDLFTVADWSYRDAGEEKVELVFTLQSASGKPIRMIDAQFGLKDALGGTIGTTKLPRDMKITPNGTYSETNLWGVKLFDRLLTIERADITPFTCVRGVVYDDGTKELF